MKNLRFACTCVLVMAAVAAAGQYDQSKINKKAIESYNQALEKAQDGRYNDAIGLLKEAIQKDAKYIDAYLSLAGIYGQIKNHSLSVAQYEKAFSLDTNYTSDYRLPYSINLAGLGQFNKALQTIDALLTRSSLADATKKAALYRKKTYQFAVDFEKAHASDGYVFTPKNLGEGINTAESEYFPSLPIAGSEIIFTRRINGFNEDFFGALKNGEAWSRAVRLTGSINTAQNEGAQNISQDGNWLVFTGCNREGGYGSCDLYISYVTNSGWSEALNLGGTVNSDQWDSQPCLSPDKRDLYFASTRPGGFGGSDLYVSHLLANGRWSEPENLGPSVNTAADEFCPFIHADNQTLYFTSNGLPGYGDQDIYLVRKSSEGKWETPQNLGYPVNTTSQEGTLFIAADGKTAYYASDRSEGKGGLDIYSFDLRPDIRPNKTLWVRGKVFDQKTNAGLPSAVELTDLAS
ncbi:MAG TPA: flagellar motor protein MotB, partial [Flavisolibacter sp.]|nr:flagellar motor protein MotB [Flavisolibacter sp.]